MAAKTDWTTNESVTNTKLNTLGAVVNTGIGVSASDYADADGFQLHACDSVANFTAVNASSEQATPFLDTSIKNEGTGSAYIYLYVRKPTTSQFYVDLASNISLAGCAEVAIDLRVWGQDGVGATGNMPDYIRLVAADAVGLGGNRCVADDLGAAQYPWLLLQTWVTVRVPVATLTYVRSVGIESNSTDLNTNLRGPIWIDNIRLLDATGIDRAVYGAAAGSLVVVPAGYTSANVQRSLTRMPAISIEDRRT